jgi:hypothetical protein
MSVLARELDSYQRAAQAYQRDVDRYNRQVDQYKETLVYDANGNMLVMYGGGVYAVGPDGKLTPTRPPGRVSDYGQSPIPEDPKFSALRQGEPVGTRRELMENVQRFYDPETGQEYYYTWAPGSGDSGDVQNRLGPEWTVERKVPGFSSGDNYSPDTYVMGMDVPTYMEKPPEWTKQFNRQAPDPTFAQVKRAGMPSLAQIEGGLIGQVLRGRGAR